MRGRRRRGVGADGGETAAQEQLFVFAVEMEDLEGALARAFEGFPAVFAVGAGAFAQPGQTGVETGGQLLFARAPGGVGRAAFLFEDAVFLKTELVELVAKSEVAGEDVGETHRAALPARGTSDLGGRKPSILARVAETQESWPDRQAAMRASSTHSDGGVSPASVLISA